MHTLGSFVHTLYSICFTACRCNEDHFCSLSALAYHWHKYSRIRPPRVAQLFNQWAWCVSIVTSTEKERQYLKKFNLINFSTCQSLGK